MFNWLRSLARTSTLTEPPWQDIISSLPTHPFRRYTNRHLSQITKLSIHHSADELDPWRWARYHILPEKAGGPSWTGDDDGDGFADGAPGIAYHCAVMLDGTAYKCNRDSTVSWHTAGHNHDSVGIVFQGDLRKRPPTEEQLKTGIIVVSRYMKAYGIRLRDIRGHGEWQGGGTECPGTWLPQMLRAVLSGG